MPFFTFEQNIFENLNLHKGIKRYHLPRKKLLFYSIIFCINNLPAEVQPPAQITTFEKIIVKSDIPFDREEFFYLTNLQEKKPASQKDILDACKNLKLKNRFLSIETDTAFLDENSKHKKLIFTLTSNWIFKNVSIKNVSHKNEYKNLYLQHPGNVFDISLHEESIDAIKDFLHKKGFFNASVTDEIFYNKKEKTISVTITINKKKQFFIKNIFLSISPKNTDLPKPQKITLDRCISQYKNKKFSEHTISHIKKDIKNTFEKNNATSRKLSRIKMKWRSGETVDLFIKIFTKEKFVAQFEGNNFFSSSELIQKYIKAPPSTKSPPFTDEEKPSWLLDLSFIAEEILHDYHRHGFWSTKIRFLTKKTPHKKHIFKIKEGKRAKINQVLIQKRASPSTKVSPSTRVSPSTKASPSTRVPPSTKAPPSKNESFDKECHSLEKKYFSQKKLDDYLEKLKNYHLKNGFWDFSIESKEYIEVQPPTKAPDTFYNILITTSNAHTGKQRFLGDVVCIKTSHNKPPKIVNIKPLQKLLKRYRGLTEHDYPPFNIAWLAEQRLAILQHYQNNGYWYAEAQPTFKTKTQSSPKAQPSAKTQPSVKTSPSMTEQPFESELQKTGLLISVTWNITPGPKVSFGKTIIRGSTKLPFKKIIKKMQFKESEPWDIKKIDYSRKKLKELNLFKYVAIQPKKLSVQEKTKPIIVTLLDDDPVELKLRGGYFLTSKNFLLKRDSTYKFGATVTAKNPFNLADKLSLETNITRFEKYFDLDYTVPDVFGETTTSKAKLYFHKYIHPLQVGKKSDSAYEATQDGFLLGINKEYKQRSFWGINFGCEWAKTSRSRGNINFSQNLLNKTIPYFFIEPNILIDKLDNKLNPKKGSLTFGSIKIRYHLPRMSPLNNSKASPTHHLKTTYKIMYEKSFFYPIYKNVVTAFRARLGHIFQIGEHAKFESIMPIERFYLGGPQSVRGYSKDTVPPLGETKTKSGTQYTIQGGSSMINGNAELRFPIYQNFGGVIFQDIGTLSQTSLASCFSQRWYPTTGFGLRYKTPIGSVRFDIGFKWKKHPSHELPYGWYLTLGQAF